MPIHIIHDQQRDGNKDCTQEADEFPYDKEQDADKACTNGATGKKQTKETVKRMQKGYQWRETDSI